MTEWWRSAVFYQIYPRSFADANGDGVGDLAGIIDRLDHLERLGVDAVWLSPICRSPQCDNGYDISDYRDIDPVFGTLPELDRLTEEVHRRGMRLVMDIVVNHTSSRHPWFLESRSSTDSALRDWYWWRPPRPGYEPGESGAEPTNWSSFFSGPTWTLDETTGEYYLHLFSAEQPDLNWEHRDVRQAVYEMMRWWLARGVDGFRLDVINLISKNPRLPDGAATPGELGDGFAHYANGPRLHEFLAEMHREVVAPHDGPVVMIGEMPGVTAELAAQITDPGRHELDMVIHFEHVSLDHDGSKFTPRPLDLVELKATLGRWQDALGAAGWNCLYWSNHDQPRAVSRFGDDEGDHWAHSATALATVLHLQRGTPFVYQGEELGMTNAAFTDVADYRDVESLNHIAAARASGAPLDGVLAGLRAMGRDNARTPMQWDASPAAGFTTGTPWIAVNSNHRWLNAAAQYRDAASVFNYYRALVDLRHRDEVVVEGDFTMLLADDPHVFAFTRSRARRRLLVLGNLSAEPRHVDVDQVWAAACIVLCNYGVPPVLPLADLRPWEARVLEHQSG